MSYPDPPSYAPMPTPRPPGRRLARIVLAILGGAAAVGIGVGIGAAGDTPTPKAAASSSASVSSLPAVDVEEPTEDPTFAELGVDDFEMELRTTSKQCFGSAGCNLTVAPELTYLGLTEDIDPDATYQITYEITGGDSGPVTETLSLTGGEDYTAWPEVISTVSSGTKLSVEITDVITR